jgi:hypothetical protein
MIRILATALLATSAPAPAQDTDFTQTGNGLLRTCSDTTSSFDKGICGGYIVGVIDGMKHLSPEKDKGLFCIPATVSNKQKTDIVFKYLSDHPESRHKNASLLIAFSMMEAFPCTGN